MNLSKLSPFLLSVLRLVTGALFIEHGTTKVLGIPHSEASGHYNFTTLAGLSGPIELVGGALVLIGLFTRPAAFILSGEMAVAYFMVHAPKGFFPMSGGGNGGEMAVLYCFVFLYLFAAGGGPFSLDRLRGRP